MFWSLQVELFLPSGCMCELYYRYSNEHDLPFDCQMTVQDERSVLSWQVRKHLSTPIAVGQVVMCVLTRYRSPWPDEQFHRLTGVGTPKRQQLLASAWLAFTYAPWLVPIGHQLSGEVARRGVTWWTANNPLGELFGDATARWRHSGHFKDTDSPRGDRQAKECSSTW